MTLIISSYVIPICKRFIRCGMAISCMYGQRVRHARPGAAKGRNPNATTPRVMNATENNRINIKFFFFMIHLFLFPCLSNTKHLLLSLFNSLLPDDFRNEKIDVVTSFDVIEHVDDPNAFVRDVYELLAPRGIGIIGTPTDAPFMREMIGEPFERTQLFSTQHLWVLSEDNLKIMSKKAGFKSFNVRYFQRYGIKNFLGWMKEKKPNSTIVSSSISSTIDMAWKSHLENRKMSDYIVLYVTK